MNNFSVLFLSGFFRKDKETLIASNSKKAPQLAANNLQWGFVKGFDNCISPNDFTIVNAPFLGDWPFSYKSLFYKGGKFSHNGDSCDFEATFCTLVFFKHFSRYFSLKKPIKKWCREPAISQKHKVLLAYAMTNSNIRALKLAKRINPSVTTVLIVPDLPQYMNTSTKQNPLYSFLKGIDMDYLKKESVCVDYFVLLTKYMADYLQLNDNFVVVEGIAENGNSNSHFSQERTILYTGTLNERYGIKLLIEAFSLIKDSRYRLIICGAGDSEDFVLAASKQDSRIEYRGLVPKSEVLKLQTEARLLINPRQNDEEFVKFSFPSKIMEYLSSGTPLLAYKLDGVPEEYDSYIYYVEGTTAEDLCMSILEVCEKPDDVLMSFGKAAQQFVLTKKNATAQCKKVLEFLSKAKEQD